MRTSLTIAMGVACCAIALSCTETTKTPAAPRNSTGYLRVRADSIATRVVPFHEDSVAIVIFSHVGPTECRGVAIQMSLRSDYERIWATAHEYPGVVDCPYSRDTAFVLGWHMSKDYPRYIDFVQPDSSIIHITQLRRTHTVSAPHQR